MAKRNCWDIKKCCRQRVGKNAQTMGTCPAAVSNKFNGINFGECGGRFCWAVKDACRGEVSPARRVARLKNCINCMVFKIIQDEEGNGFVMMPSALKDRSQFREMIVDPCTNDPTKAGKTHGSDSMPQKEASTKASLISGCEQGTLRDLKEEADGLEEANKLNCDKDTESLKTPEHPLSESWNPIIDKIDDGINSGKKFVGITLEPQRRIEGNLVRRVVVKFKEGESAVIMKGIDPFLERKFECAKIYVDAMGLLERSE